MESSDDRIARDVIRGTARNAKAGAVVVDAEDRTIYLDGMREWDEETLGRRVVVRGRLERAKYIPDPDDGSGGIMQGAYGEQWVMREPSWELAR